MLKRTKLTSLFTWKARSGNTTAPIMPLPLVSITAGMLFDSTASLSLDRFIKCSVFGDLNQLKVNAADNIPEITLKQIWDSIYEQFVDGIQDKEGIEKTRIMGKINHLKFTYELIQLSAKFLETAFHPEIIQVLSKHIRVTGNFNPDNIIEYRRDIQILLNRAQGIQADIQSMEAGLRMVKMGDNVTPKSTLKQFDQLVAQVSIYAKFHVDKKLVSVGEFIEYYSSMRNSQEAIEEINAKYK